MWTIMVLGIGNSQEKKDLKSELFSYQNLLIFDQISRLRKIDCPRLPLIPDGSNGQYK